MPETGGNSGNITMFVIIRKYRNRANDDDYGILYGE